MTCIAAIADGKSVWMAGDSAGSDGYDKTIRSDPKVFARGEFLVGYTTSFRMGQLLRFHLRIPPRQEAQDAYEYMVTAFIPAVRECLKSGGFASKEDERERGGEFLVGYRGNLYCIHGDYQVACLSNQFYAVGCGAPYALGSMFATKHQEPSERLRKALDAASNLSAHVAPPFVVLHAPEEKLDTRKKKARR